MVPNKTARDSQCHQLRSLWAVIILGWLVLALPVSASVGSLVHPSPRSSFKELIGHVERPEIVMCMVAAQQKIRRDPKLDELSWDLDVSLTAHVEDNEQNGQLFRKMILRALGHDRHAWLISGWHPIGVWCEQTEGVDIRVQFVTR